MQQERSLDDRNQFVQSFDITQHREPQKHYKTNISIERQLETNNLGFLQKDVISILDFTRTDLEHLLQVSNEMIPIAEGKQTSKILEGKVLGVLFYEPSTRTRLSFESAMLRLGGGVTGFATPAVTRVSGSGNEPKEELDDTIRVIENYVDVMVIRSLTEGSAKMAANYARIPVINGGDGVTEHPTQAMLDLLTIQKEKGRIDGLKIVQIGNLAGSRSQKSFSLGVSNFKVDLVLASSRKQAYSKKLIDKIESKLGRPPTIVNQRDPLAQVRDADIIRVTTGPYLVNKALLKKLKPDATILHPLPRGPEVARDVDKSPNAAYFRQTFYGVCTRMGLLSLILGAIQ